MHKIRKLVILCCILLALTGTSFQFVIESSRVTNWGNWGGMEVCPEGSFVFGFRLKVEPYQSIASDDCSLSAVELLCISPTAKRGPSAPLYKSNHTGLLSKAFATIISKEGYRGDWGPVQECAEPGFATGFQLKSESDQGWYADDSAANGMRLFCSDGQRLDSGNEMNFGSWTAETRCPRGHYACGLETQVEDRQSKLNFYMP